MRKNKKKPQILVGCFNFKDQGTMHCEETKGILLSFVVTHILLLAQIVPWHDILYTAALLID